jgi:hypothetical protein
MAVVQVGGEGVVVVEAIFVDGWGLESGSIWCLKSLFWMLDD